MTFSITARCRQTGQFGIAVSTKVPAVGSLCPYVEAGVGAIASQSYVNPYIGIHGLKYLKEGLSAEQTLEKILQEEKIPEIRQFSIVDKTGKAVAYTGEKCLDWHGHLVGDHVAVAGNLLVGEATIQHMLEVFEQTEQSDMSLAARLLQALEAGQKAGGDRRGRQSAALKVVGTEAYPLVDLRVDEHVDPVKELRRIYEIAREELFPFVSSLPTYQHPTGRLDDVTKRELKLDVD
ncbi:DUF1028 domain-containing protein [Virgibacillus soli]|uniref:DUF1028 domain-containing protein n=1 Tax=Paracerasibacillus soli TaxID=480284 RepID=UPI0035EB0AE1